MEVLSTLLTNINDFKRYIICYLYNSGSGYVLQLHMWMGNCMCVRVQMGYLPVQRSLVTIKWVHYDEKFTVLFLQVFHVFALRMIIFDHFHDGHVLWRRGVSVSQMPESSERKFDDKLQILSKDGQENGVRHRKSIVNITYEKESFFQRWCGTHFTTNFIFILSSM